MAEDDETGRPDRRIFRRTDLTQIVEICPLDNGGEGVRGEMVNVGCGGILARVGRGLRESIRCQVRMVSPEDDVESCSRTGVVVRVREADAGDYLAVRFDDRIDTLRSPADAGRPEPPFQLLPSRVLVVDDERTIRRVLARFFRSRGCDVDVASDGEQALAFLRRETSDMLLLDIRMPKVDGLEVLRAIQEENLRVGPIWAISGYASDEEAKEALRLGAADFISKPLDLKYLDWSLKLHRLGGVAI